MSAQREVRHWADDDVELLLEVGDQGHEQYTGQVCCPKCLASAVRPEDIVHELACTEPRYTSEWDQRRRHRTAAD